MRVQAQKIQSPEDYTHYIIKHRIKGYYTGYKCGLPCYDKNRKNAKPMSIDMVNSLPRDIGKAERK
jgi:hypothetical protein